VPSLALGIAGICRRNTRLNNKNVLQKQTSTSRFKMFLKKVLSNALSVIATKA
jgi:hypothetical protein